MSGLAAGGLVLGLLVGCAAPRAEIPVGRWVGQGSFVVDTWDSGPELYDPAGASAQWRTYATEFAAERTTHEGEAVTRVEILSRRGPLVGDDTGDRTHIILLVKPVRAVGHAAVLLKSVDMAIALEDKTPEEAGAAEVPVNIVCQRFGDEIVVQVAYMDGFTDRWCFRGGTLRKYGMYGPGADMHGVVAWVEELKRR